LLDISFVISLNQEGLDQDDLVKRLGNVFGEDYVDSSVEGSIIVTVLSRGGDIKHFTANKMRVIQEMVFAAVKRAQRRKPRVEVES
jgi:hypothetical protein